MDDCSVVIRCIYWGGNIMNEVLNLKEAASFLGVDKRTLKKGVLAGSVPAMQISNRYFFSKAALKLALNKPAQKGKQWEKM